ncbi:uncharacterized protein LOC112906509 [Agrilus planipennis]|uniref:Uncharacterized protein LOC112906102 n=1 Tax=Agrilus planipennis TaxID=224129 RepID=A0A7F5RL16_AGRPL|nr:uncharacterized protein LOC112906102 [Agrilus planipennis]XP_025836525.1 uncharacterized protein LOC112906509 [Agrilus planipennis]
MKYFKFVLSVFMIGWLIVCYASTTVRARAVDLKIVNAKIVPSASRKVGDKVLRIDTNNEKFLRNEKKVNIPQDPEDLAIVFGVGKLKDFDENFKNAIKKQEAQLKVNDLAKKISKSSQNTDSIFENVSTDKDAPWYNFDKLMVKWDTFAPYYEIVMSLVKNKKLHEGLGTVRKYIINFGTLLKGMYII